MSSRRRRDGPYTSRLDVAQIAHTAAVADDSDPCPGSCNDIWVAAERVAFNEQARARGEPRPPRPEHQIKPGCCPPPQPEPATHGVPMIPAEPVWCRPCQEHITATIAGFPAQCGPLTPGPLNTPRDTPGGRPSAGVSPPSPSPAWDQADEIIRWAVNAEDQLRAHIGDHQFGQRPWRTLSSAVTYLTGHATALLSCPDAVAIGFDALRLAARLTQVTGSDRLIHRLPGTCMLCERRSLQRKDGDDLVKCRACGASWDWGHYQFLAKTYADAVNA